VIQITPSLNLARVVVCVATSKAADGPVRAREPVVTLGCTGFVLTEGCGRWRMADIRACPGKLNPQL